MTALTAPLNPLACHIGNGTVLLTWLPPASGTPAKYEVWASEQLTGPYYKYLNGNFETGTADGVGRGQVYNVTLGINAYFQIRAIDSDGNAGPFAQFQAGQITKPTIQCRITAITGSLIKAGTVFSVLDKSDRIIGIQAIADINVNC